MVGHFVRAARMRIGRSNTTCLLRAETIAVLLAIGLGQFPAHARVLSDADLDRISSLKKMSIDVMTDITMVSRRGDLSQADSDCVKSTLKSLTQIADELQSYEYLITIE